MESNGKPKGYRHRLQSRISRMGSSSTPVLPYPGLPDALPQSTSQDDLRTRKSATAASLLKKLVLRTPSQRTESSSPHALITGLVPQLSGHGIDTPPTTTADLEGVHTASFMSAVEGPTVPATIAVKFTREPKRAKDSELKMLHYSYIMSEFTSLREAVKLAHSLTETSQTGPTAHDCVYIAKMSSAYITSLINNQQRSDAAPLDLDSMMKDFVNVLREVQKTIYGLPEVLEKTVEDWKREKVVTDQCKAQLESAISKNQEKLPALSKPSASQDSAPTNFKSVISSVLGASILVLTILNEAADIIPIPFLKGSVGTILIILETAEVTRSNREDILELAYMAEDFIASIWEACQGSNGALSNKFQTAIDAFTKVLLDILDKAQAFSKRSLLSRVVSQNSDKNDILVCKQQLQNAINEFQVITQVLQQHTLDAILAGQKDVIGITQSTLLATLPQARISFEQGDYVATTRTDILETISEWIEDPTNSSQVFWLYGAAGIGKSTISRRLRVVLSEGGRLAGHFFFQRQSTEQERPDLVIGTLAYQLAHVQKSMKLAVVNAIEHPSIDQLFSTRFKALVLDPLIKGTFALPTVILLDALDEYKDALQLLDVLVDCIPQFPPNVKLFITSRFEILISSRMVKLKAQQCELLSVSADVIQSIVTHRLQSIDGWEAGRPTSVEISELVRLADGLPIWAATACTFITEFSPGDPHLPLRKILEPQSDHRRDAESALDALYLAALRQIYSKAADLQTRSFRLVFGFIYVVSITLTMKDVEVLLGEDEPVRSIVGRLSSLHTRGSSHLTSDTLITPASERFHASFLDFIIDPRRCTDARFRLEIAEIHDNVARLCFRLMDDFFGSAVGCPDSYASLSAPLLYATNNWATHASHNKAVTAELHKALSNFCQHHFLTWFKLQFESVTGSSMSPQITKLYSSMMSSNLSTDCFSHFATLTLYMQQMGHPIDIIHLNMAISMQTIALHMVDRDESKRAIHLAISGRLLISRFKLAGRIQDVDSAIEHYREAISLCPLSSPQRSPLLYNLADALLARGNERSMKGDLDEAIRHLSKSLELLPEHSTSLIRTVLVGSRANALSLRFKQFGEVANLDEALSLHQEAVSKSQGLTSHTRAEFSHNLADSLDLRFNQFRRSDDLDEVITLRQYALHLLQDTREYRDTALDNLADALQAPSIHSGDGDDLYNTIPLCRQVLTICLPFNHSRSSNLENLAYNLTTRFDLHHKPGDLDESISLYRQALGLYPPGHPDRAPSLGNLGSALYSRYEKIGGVEDLNEVISLHREVLELRPPGHPNRTISLNSLGIALHCRFEQFGQTRDLDEVISLHRQALELRPPNHSDRAISLNSLGNALHSRFEQFGDVVDLDAAISLHRQALELRPPGHPNRTFSLNNLGVALHSRFEQFGQAEDLDEVISIHRQALELRPPGHPDRSSSLNSLGNGLHARFEEIGQVNNLDEAISLHRQALELRPLGHPKHTSSLQNLGMALHSRFEEVGEIGDLDEAIFLHRQALELRSPGHPNRTYAFASLGIALHSRFEELGEIGDLDEAILFHRHALELRPPGHPYRTSSLSSLGNSLHSRFEKTVQVRDVDEAISLHRQALELRLSGQPNYESSLNNLGIALHSRFEKIGDGDLDEVILLDRQALELRPPDHPEHTFSLNNLGNALHSRFEETGEVENSDEAISLYRQALELRPPGHLKRATSFFNLGNTLRSRFEKTGAVGDLDEAILLLRQALELRPPGHPDRANPLNALAYGLQARPGSSGLVENLDEAVSISFRSLVLSGHPHPTLFLDTLGSALCARFTKSDRAEDLDEIVSLFRQALELSAQPHPILFLDALGSALYARFIRSDHVEDLNEAVSLFLQALQEKRLAQVGLRLVQAL